MTTIVHISDLHFDDTEPGSVEALRESIESIGPALIVVSGDLTLRGGIREFRSARRFLDSLASPILVVPGNHDIPAFNPIARFGRPLGRFRDLISRDLSPRVRASGVSIIGLNSARPWDLSWNWSHGRLSRAQIELADDFFGNDPSGSFRCVVVHHPFVVPDGMPGFRSIGNRELMQRVLHRRRVDLVLSGHLHKGFWRVLSDGSDDTGFCTLIVQASTATSRRLRDEPNAFNVIVFDQDSIRLTPWVRHSGPFLPGSVVEFRRSERGWDVPASRSE
jgi:3',5'-cyclic AMP phosphodiesterase CpdA